jgi:hypothetical protein
MLGLVRSCLGKLLVLVFLAGAVAALWWWNPGLIERLRGGAPLVERREAPSPELADATLERFETFRRGRPGDEFRVGETELSSLLRYRLANALPGGVRDVAVTLRESQVHLTLRVPFALLPEVPALSEVARLLPDTVRVEIRGSLTPFGPSSSALHVSRLDVSRVPLPARFIPEILTILGRTEAPGLPEDALLVLLPPGLRSAFVLRDSLVLVAGP